VLLIFKEFFHLGLVSLKCFDLRGIPLSNFHRDSVEVVRAVAGESNTPDLDFVVTDDTIVL